jgi:hypothetical protein
VCQFELAGQNGALHLGRGEIVVVIEADLPDSYHTRLASQLRQARE